MDMPASSSKGPAPKAGVAEIAAYVGGKSKLSGFAEPIKLSSNENALRCSPHAIEAFEAARAKLFRYPDGHAAPLREAVAKHHGLEPERLIFGNGSDEVFAMLNQTYLEVGDNIVSGEHGFLAYRISAEACQAEVRLAAEPERRIEVERLYELVDARTRIVYISNPANPTGTFNTVEEIMWLHGRLDPSVLLVIDEAYAEFADDPAWSSMLHIARGLNNVVVTRTFSKIYGLAGLRVGFGYAPVEVIAMLDRTRMPFNVNLPAQYAAIAALADTEHLEASRQQVVNWRPRLIQEIRAQGLKVEASACNFVLIDFGTAEAAIRANEHLMSHGIIVRHVAAYSLPQCLRVTVGMDEENRAFLDALKGFAG
jgi:histidinol-phosphate aminotransferase